MPRWNLGDIMSHATHRVGRRADIPQSIASLYANQAYHDVIEMSEPYLLERIAVSSTTSNENRINLPNDFNKPIVLSWLTNIGSARTLQMVNSNEVDAEGFDSLGIPDRYVLYSDWIELFPSPDSSYSLQFRYLSYTTDLEEKSDLPSLASAWRFPVVLKAVEYLQGWLGDEDREAAARIRFIDHVSTLETERAKRHRTVDAMRVKVIY